MDRTRALLLRRHLGFLFPDSASSAQTQPPQLTAPSGVSREKRGRSSKADCEAISKARGVGTEQVEHRQGNPLANGHRLPCQHDTSVSMVPCTCASPPFPVSARRALGTVAAGTLQYLKESDGLRGDS